MEKPTTPPPTPEQLTETNRRLSAELADAHREIIALLQENAQLYQQNTEYAQAILDREKTARKLCFN